MNLPTQLTLLRILLTPVFVLLLFLGGAVTRLLSFAVFTIASITDWYDGYAARKYGDVSMWGKFLDPLADKILFSSGFISFSVLGYIPAWMVLIIVIRDFTITGFRSYALLKGKPIVTNMLAKTKTFGQFGVVYIIFIFHLFVAGKEKESLAGILQTIVDIQLILILMYVITFLTVISGIVYIVENRSHLRMMVIDIYRIFVPSDI
jgi:CDP-diacylglycerol--glycerol-3-phosphate 3-phosphatidyltransferase